MLCSCQVQENLPVYRGCHPRPTGQTSRPRWLWTESGLLSGPRLQGAFTHLGLLLVQLYLNVCELGPEVFVGSLEGDNECLGLLALISPFLGHCFFLNGVCWFLILSNGCRHVTGSYPGGRCFSIYCVVLLGKVSSAALEALRRGRDSSDYGL